MTRGKNKTRKCSRCYRPVKGHQGAYGQKCTLPILSSPASPSEANLQCQPQPQSGCSFTETHNDQESVFPTMDHMSHGNINSTGSQHNIGHLPMLSPTMPILSPAMGTLLPTDTSHGHSQPTMPASDYQDTKALMSQFVTQMAAISSQLQQMSLCQQLIVDKLSNSHHGVPLNKPESQQASHADPGPAIARPSTQPSLTTPDGHQAAAVGGVIPGLRSDVDAITNYKDYSPIEGLSDSTIKSCLKGEFAYLDQFLLNVTISQEGLGELQQIVDNDG